MIVRIVEMHFKPEHVEDFKLLFEKKIEKIRSFPGCLYLELLQGTIADTTTLSTYSHWESAQALEDYRYSDLFAETWKETKSLFSARAKAQSYERLHKLP